MNYQSTGRNQRPKGFMVKRALQFALLLAVCIWLLYQIKHSHDKREDYGGSMQSKLNEENGAVILGRKGNAGWSSDGGESVTGDVNAVGEGEKREDGGGGDDELDRSVEEKAEDEKEPKTQYKEAQNNEDNNSDVEVREGDGVVVLNKDMSTEEYFSRGHENSHGNVSDNDERGEENDPERQVSHDVRGDEKDSETQVKETQNNKEDNTDTQEGDQDETVGSYKENDEDKEPTKIEEKIAMQRNVKENATVHGQSEMVNGVLGFHDENGVPQDSNDLVESMPTESSEDQANIIRQKTISSLNNQSRITEVEEVAGKEGSKSILEDSKIETTNDAEINSETSVHTDTSSIRHASETTQEDSRVSEDSESLSSKQEQEEVTYIKIFPQDEKEAESTD